MWDTYFKNSPCSIFGTRTVFLYLDVGLPGRGSVNILQLIKDCYTLLSEKSLSVTSNLPSLMNGGKDFCDWSKNDRKIAAATDGLSVQKTADQLSLNYETLRSRIKKIYRKMGAQNKTEAVMIARETKLI